MNTLPTTSTRPLRALELFCGIGGFAAALPPNVEVTAAIDLGSHVLSVYRHNFPEHNALQQNLEYLSEEELGSYEADIWWMSPPCQPYTTRGKERDLQDRRARSLIHLLALIEELRPAMIGMENVEGFLGSEAWELVLRTLKIQGYEIHEEVLCPTELGIPARRRRYYLVASLHGLRSPNEMDFSRQTLKEFLDPEPAEELFVPEEIVATHGPGMRIIDLEKTPYRIANTFTGAYGKTWQAAGSYLQTPGGRVRRFSPKELLRLLGFPEAFQFPQGYSRRLTYKAIGNSLSVVVMRRVLSRLLIPPPVETQ